MQIVIDIPKEMYETIKNSQRFIAGQRIGKTYLYTLMDAVFEGTPLPENHGDLIDRKAIYNHMISIAYGLGDNIDEIMVVRASDIDNAPIVLEATEVEE